MKPFAPQRVLVKAVNWLGDLVISLPALHAVRRAFPQARLAVLVKRDLAGFFDDASWIDEIVPYSLAAGTRGLRDRWRIITAIGARRFDLAILFPKSFDAALWPALAGVPRRVGLATDGRGWLLTDKTVVSPAGKTAHQAHIYVQMLHDTLGIDGNVDDYTIEVSSRHRNTMIQWLAARRHFPTRPLVALAPAAAFGPAKEWPIGSYSALVDLLAARGAECVLVGSPGERQTCEAVAAGTRQGALVSAGDTQIGEAVALLSLCNGFAGNDSGSMHVAGALGLPTVGIFGSTNPQRTGPLGSKTCSLYYPIECSPCLQRTCRYGHYNCLRQITPEGVMRALTDLGALGLSPAS